MQRNTTAYASHSHARTRDSAVLWLAVDQQNLARVVIHAFEVCYQCESGVMEGKHANVEYSSLGVHNGDSISAASERLPRSVLFDKTRGGGHIEVGVTAVRREKQMRNKRQWKKRECDR